MRALRHRRRLSSLVPVAQDPPGVSDGVFEGGFRHSNYSVSGGVNTWKLGLQYAPILGNAVGRTGVGQLALLRVDAAGQ